MNCKGVTFIMRAGSGEYGVRVVNLPCAESSSRFTELMERLVIDGLGAAGQKGSRGGRSR